MSYGQPQPPYQQTGYGAPPPGYAQQPYAPPMAPNQQPAGGCSCLTISLAVLGAIILGCCGLGGFAWFSVGVFTGAVQTATQQEPAVQEHLGEIREFTTNFEQTGAAAQRTGNEKTYVFDVRGTRGNGQVEVQIRQEGNNITILEGELRMDSGETFPLGQP